MPTKKFIFLLLLTVGNAQQKPYCNQKNFDLSKWVCGNAYIGAVHTGMAAVCGNLNCFLQCLKESLLDCQKTDEFFYYDIDKLVVEYRAECNNVENRQRARAACDLSSCDSLLPRKEDFSDYVEFKKAACKSANTTVNCLQTATVSSNCTSDLEELQKGLTTVQHSYSECGIRQNHPFFRQYAGDTPCQYPNVDTRCLATSLSERISRCLTMPDLTELTEDVVEKACSNLECNLKCYLDAIGDCNMQDQWVNKDPKTIIVTGRAICEDYRDAVLSMNLCKINNQSCEEDFNTAVSKAEKQIQNNEYDDYKTMFCRAAVDFKTCVDISVTSTCTASMAERAKSMYQVAFSFAACGLQEHPYFMKYRDDVSCKTSGYEHIRILSFIQMCVVTVILMMSF